MVAAVGIAQLLVSWHEATVRHVRCLDHGELTDVRVVETPPSAYANRLSTADFSRRTTASGHEHCWIEMALRVGEPARRVKVAIRFVPPPVIVPGTGDLDVRPGRTFLLASAPKTSPPLT